MPNVSWEDIGGLENVKRELQEVLTYFLALCFHTIVSSTNIKYLVNSFFYLFAVI